MGFAWRSKMLEMRLVHYVTESITVGYSTSKAPPPFRAQGNFRLIIWVKGEQVSRFLPYYGDQGGD